MHTVLKKKAINMQTKYILPMHNVHFTLISCYITHNKNIPIVLYGNICHKTRLKGPEDGKQHL